MFNSWYKRYLYNYSKDLVLKNSKVSEQQTFISYLGLSRKIGETILSFGFSIILSKFELIHVIFILLILSGISFIVNYKLYKKLKWFYIKMVYIIHIYYFYIVFIYNKNKMKNYLSNNNGNIEKT